MHSTRAPSPATASAILLRTLMDGSKLCACRRNSSGAKPQNGLRLWWIWSKKPSTTTATLGWANSNRSANSDGGCRPQRRQYSLTAVFAVFVSFFNKALHSALAFATRQSIGCQEPWPLLAGLPTLYFSGTLLRPVYSGGRLERVKKVEQAIKNTARDRKRVNDDERHSHSILNQLFSKIDN